MNHVKLIQVESGMSKTKTTNVGPLIVLHLAIISFVLVTFELHSTLFICCFIVFCLFFFSFLSAVCSAARTTLAARWLAVPGTVCLLTRPRCTPSPRPAAQGRGLSRSRGRAQVSAPRPADRHGCSPRAHWARRQPLATMTMMPTAVRDLRTFLSVGECAREGKPRGQKFGSPATVATTASTAAVVQSRTQCSGVTGYV